jgi:hypothetical protein
MGISAKDLRQKSTDAERKLWGALRDRRLHRMKFRRQQQIGRYIVDFVCFETRLIIEVDGAQHANDPPDRTVFWCEADRCAAAGLGQVDPYALFYDLFSKRFCKLPDEFDTSDSCGPGTFFGTAPNFRVAYGVEEFMALPCEF